MGERDDSVGGLDGGSAFSVPMPEAIIARPHLFPSPPHQVRGRGRDRNKLDALMGSDHGGAGGPPHPPLVEEGLHGLCHAYVLLVSSW